MNQQLTMRPQDIVILSKIVCLQDRPWQYRNLSTELYIPLSEISVSIQRSSKAGLMNAESRKVNSQSFMEFLEYGLKYVFPVSPQTMVTGIATAHSHPFYKTFFKAETDYVWPDDAGNIRGLAIQPFHTNIPKAAKKDEMLYKLLAGIDILRVGRPRELAKALDELKKTVL